MANKVKGFEPPRINTDNRKYDSVRAIYKENFHSDSENDFNRVMGFREACNFAKFHGLDVIEINAKACPPIVRIADYSKFLYEQKKQAKQQTKGVTEVKEIQLRTNISEHDLQTKANKAAEFLRNGCKVKVVLTMRGRELTRKEESKKALYLFITMLDEYGVPESMPRDDNNRSTVIIKKRK